MTKLINEASIPALLQEMTSEEKIYLLVGATFFSTGAQEKYGIPAIRYLDGATGVNMMQLAMEMLGIIIREMKKEPIQVGNESNNESGAGAVDFMRYVTNDDPVPEDMPEGQKYLITELRRRINALRPEGAQPGCFPPGMLLGATWEPSVVYDVGEAVAREAMAFSVDVLLGTPNTNIHRDPKNGRVFESFSEDPCLSRAMAPQFVRGVQDQGVIADVKHFAANNQETLRQGIDEHISERALREIYLPGFEAAVKEGKVETVMSAYNSINGVPCAHNHWLLTEVLKEEWGFAGQVVSDWGAVYDQVTALNAGNDMDMPGPRGKELLYKAVADGTISMERLDDAVTRTLRMILKTPTFCGKKYTAIDEELSAKAAYRAAAEGITLLKNDGLLPLAQGTKLALFGRCTDRFMDSGSGSAQVDTTKTTSLPVELSRYTDSVVKDRIASDTEVVIITAGASGQEGSDRPAMDFDEEDKTMLIQALAQARAAGKKTILVLNVAGPVELLPHLDDVDALVCVYFPGMEGARALTDILFGSLSPSGKLPLTFPRTYRQTPTAINFPGEGGKVNYGEGIFVGYRYYDYKDIDPLYPFGFGLSYSTFSMRGLTAPETYHSKATEPMTVRVKVKNEGTMEAKEVVQLYVRAKSSTVLRPDKELKAFRKVHLQPGEEKTVELTLLPKDFAFYESERHSWLVEPGEYTLLVGNSSRNILASADITVCGPDPYGCSIYTPIARIAKNKKAMDACCAFFGPKFEPGKLLGNVHYFGSTPLKKHLYQALSDVDKTEPAWTELMNQLQEHLEQIC